jgi:ABC-type transport system involved in multi-copper enzyme maturation permease subunit
MSGRQNSLVANVLAVLEFELRRAMTVPRLAWWCVLAFFPVLIVTLVTMVPITERRGDEFTVTKIDIPIEIWSSFLFALIPMLISMLGTFLWTTPAVSAEIERQSWVYLAVRPHGRAAVLLGKYLASILWVLPAALAGTTFAVLVIYRSSDGMAAPGVAREVWWTIARLSCLSVPSYSAIYLALGTIFTKRAMVMAVAYTLIFELVVSWVPALINKLTIQYRLRALFFNWADIDVTQAGRLPPIDIFSAAPPWVHVSILFGWMIALVTFSVALVRSRDYVVSSTPEA